MSQLPKSTKLTNDDFLGCSPGEDHVEDARIPAGYGICHFKQFYIPVSQKGDTWTCYYLGSGSNPHTRDIPVHFVANAGGLRRAMKFLEEAAAVDRQRGKTC